jgi:PAS domain S-box-containing protein
MSRKPSYEELKKRVRELEREASDRKKSVSFHSESEQLFRLLFENMSVGVALVDNQGHVVVANEADCLFLGYPKEELEGMHFSEFTYPEDMDLDISFYEELVKGDRDHYSIDKRYLRKDGKVVWGRLNVSMLKSESGRPLYTVISCEDIDRRKKAEDALRESEENLSITLHSIWDAVIAIDESGIIVRMNPVAEALTGWNHAEAIGRHLNEVFKIINEKTREPVGNPVEKVLLEGVTEGLANHKILIAKNGVERIIEYSAASIRDNQGEIRGVVFIFHDATEKRRAENDLRESRERLEEFNQILAGVLDNTHMMAVFLDSKFNFIWVNRAYADTCKHEPSFFIGKNHFQVYPHKEIEGIFQRVVDTGEPFFVEARAFQFPDQPERGLTYWDWSLVPVKNEIGEVTGLVFTLAEVTRRIREEEKEGRRLDRMRRESDAVAKIALSKNLVKGKPAELAFELTREASRAIGVERVGVWLFEENGSRMVNIDNYEASKGSHCSGAVLLEHEYQNEFAWLKSAKYVDAHDALTDPRTAGYVEGYLKPHRITSMLDTAIRLKGRNLGKLCFEHVGKAHFWEEDEITFACQLADNMAFAISNQKQRQTEKSLEVLFYRQQAILAAVPDIIMEVDINKVYTWANRAGLDFFGSDVIGKEASFYFEPEQDTYEVVEPLFKGHESVFYVESWQRRNDGERRLLAWWCKVLKDEDGNPVGAISAARDITEAKIQEDRLRLHSLVLDQINDHVIITDLDGVISYVNQAMVKMLGRPKEDFIGRSINLCRNDTEKEVTQEEIIQKTLRDGSWRGEVVNFTADGSERITDWRTQVVLNDSGKPTVLCWIATDMTEYKRAEKERREIEEKFRSLEEHMLDLIFITDMDGNITYISPAGKFIFGYEPQEMEGRSFKEFCSEEDLQMASDAFQEFLSTGTPCKNLQFKMKRKDGYLFWGELNGSIFLKDGVAEGIIGIIRDITDRKLAEEERTRLISAIEQAAEIIVITDKDGEIKYVNPAFESVTGYGIDEIKGQNPRILKSGIQDEIFYKNLWETITSGETWQGRMVNKRKDGSFYTEEATISPVLNETGEIINFVAVKRDITDEIDLEKRLVQAQKMEAIGTLAGGIAHDFNNILCPIMIHSEMAMMELPDDNPVQNSLNQIHQAGERARDLVKQILTFARKGDEERLQIKASLIVKEAVKFLRSTIPTTIDIHYDITAKQDLVLADPTQLNRVVMNLCTNAAHAIGERDGTIEVSLDNECFATKSAVEFPELEPGRYLKLMVKDTGRGIEPELLDKIFEPYFTTKDVDKGTGMGLALVHSIVQGYGGKIKVQSEVGKGTTFHVYLPLAKEKKGTLKERKDTVQIPRGTERVLLVDDEKCAVDAIAPMLESLGYKVTARTSSVEAFEVFRNRPEDFDLVITDMTMPNMTGKDMAGKIMAIRSDIPVILCTGFSERIDEDSAKVMGIRAFLMKPVLMKEMANTIREIL